MHIIMVLNLTRLRPLLDQDINPQDQDQDTDSQDQDKTKTRPRHHIANIRATFMGSVHKFALIIFVTMTQ